MDNTKFTKGEIKVTEVMLGIAKGIYLSGQGQRYFLAQIITHDRPYEENLANALLFSKSPEMLEMLQRIVSLFKRGDFDDKDNLGSKLLNEANQLIKDATTI